MKSLLNITVLVIMGLLCGCSADPQITVPLSEIDGLTEERAIALTRSALVAADFNPNDFQPTPYWTTSTSLFASNRIDPETGYVLWKNISHETGLAWDYMVSIRKDGDKAVITVIRPK